jgi:phage shock protein PspC (stress-responsive transcriptional regulator)
MKKVISIHLNNKMFHIEEDAYAYLNNVLSNQWKKQELEEQIANRLEQRLIGSRIVVTYPDVVDVLYQLGFSTSDYQAPSNSSLREKRLYRQPKDKMIGGVCTGLAEFFEIDPVILRVIFVLGFFMIWGFWAYIVMWIIVPKNPNSLTA